MSAMQSVHTRCRLSETHHVGASRGLDAITHVHKHTRAHAPFPLSHGAGRSASPGFGQGSACMHAGSYGGGIPGAHSGGGIPGAYVGSMPPPGQQQSAAEDTASRYALSYARFVAQEEAMGRGALSELDHWNRDARPPFSFDAYPGSHRRASTSPARPSPYPTPQQTSLPALLRTPNDSHSAPSLPTRIPSLPRYCRRQPRHDWWPTAFPGSGKAAFPLPASGRAASLPLPAFPLPGSKPGCSALPALPGFKPGSGHAGCGRHDT
jgi:hypothetical protein